MLTNKCGKDMSNLVMVMGSTTEVPDRVTGRQPKQRLLLAALAPDRERQPCPSG